MSDAIGKRVLLPSFKMGKLIQIEPDGRKIFMEDSTGHLLCEHGERASTIGTWLLNERTARQNGTPAPPRTSSCQCQTTEGLHKSYNLAQQNPSPSTAHTKHSIAAKTQKRTTSQIGYTRKSCYAAPSKAILKNSSLQTWSDIECSAQRVTPIASLSI